MSDQTSSWALAVTKIKSNPELHAAIVATVASSMQLAGFSVDWERSARLLDEVLDGPPLLYRIGEGFCEADEQIPSGHGGE